MKVVYFNYLYDMKESSVGAAVHVKELERALQHYGHEVKTFYLNRFTSVEASYESRLRGFLKKKLWRYLNQINGVIANGRYLVIEWKIISQERPDAVLMRYNLLNFSLAIIARLKRIPLLLEVNAPLAYESRKFADETFQLPFIPEILEKLNLLLADQVIVVSTELKKFYVNWGIPGYKIKVVPNGVDEKRFHPANSAQQVVSKYQLNGKIVLGFVGSFHYWHGLENLTSFIKTTLTRYENVSFLLVGHGPLRNELESILHAEKMAKKVIFTGYVSHEEIPNYLAAMDIVLAPYPRLDLFYYSPLKLFEYMAAGKAVVASRIGQIASIITDKYNGILFQPDNFDDMRNSAFELIENDRLRRAIGDRARDTVLQRHTWSHTAEKISQVMSKVVNHQVTKFNK